VSRRRELDKGNGLALQPSCCLMVHRVYERGQIVAHLGSVTLPLTIQTAVECRDRSDGKLRIRWEQRMNQCVTRCPLQTGDMPNFVVFQQRNLQRTLSDMAKVIWATNCWLTAFVPEPFVVCQRHFWCRLERPENQRTERGGVRQQQQLPCRGSRLSMP